MKKLILTLTLLLITAAQANSNVAYLDAPYERVNHPVSDHSNFKSIAKSDFFDMQEIMTPVRAQGSRGTCSIFSAIAMLESMLIKRQKFSKSNLDLSEEWLEYVIIRNKISDGSNSWNNFHALRKYGTPTEQTMNYLPQIWKEDSLSPIANKRCGKLTLRAKKSCLLGHRDPRLLYATPEELTDETSDLFDIEFLDARNEAFQMRDDYIQFSGMNYDVNYLEDIKRLLAKGTPLTMGIDFFYGAWNHSKATEFGIGRDMNGWSQGIVGYPEEGSVDIVESKKNRAGHSVLIVGFDDNRIVKTTVKMEDGTTKTFTYKGVYYFKNSWGTGGFGKDFEIEGQNFDGYGMITQKYANEYGSFYKMPLK